MNSLPMRLRVTGAFALSMAAVLTVSGLFLYARLSSHLSAALDRDLRLRSQDLAALVSQPQTSLSQDSRGRLVEHGENYAELISPSGRVVESTEPLGTVSLLSHRDLQRAVRSSIYLDKPPVPGLDEGSRLLASTVTRGGRPVVLVVGATRQNDVETLSTFRDELMIAGP